MNGIRLLFITGITLFSSLLPQLWHKDLSPVFIDNSSSSVRISDKESLCDENLIITLKYYGLDNTDIILAQAKLETGNYSSRICREYNNIFGLYDSKNHDYYRFTSWKECVLFYKLKIYSRYDRKSDYLSFLDNIGYAEDMDYTSKIKKIIENESYYRD